jgi:hypothetical protein
MPSSASPSKRPSAGVTAEPLQLLLLLLLLLLSLQLLLLLHT